MSTAPAAPQLPRGARWILAALALAACVALGVVVAGATGGASDIWGGYDSALRRVQDDAWWSLWVFPGVLIGALVAMGVLASPSRSESHDLRRRHMWFLWAGVGVAVISLCAPLATIAQGGLLQAHMLQHVLLGALAPVLVLLGVSPAPRGTRARRRVLAVLLHPVVAFSIWLASTIVWIVPDVHHEVVARPALWLLQQVVVFLAGIALWAPITDRIVDPPEWFRTGAKCCELIVVWFTGILLANLFWFSGSVLYDGHSAGALAWGISPMQDQANSGTIMALAHCAITFVAIGILVFRHASERGLEQRLVEAGVPEDEVRAATYDGTLNDLAGRTGVAVETRTGLD